MSKSPQQSRSQLGVQLTFDDWLLLIYTICFSFSQYFRAELCNSIKANKSSTRLIKKTPTPVSGIKSSHISTRCQGGFMPATRIYILIGTLFWSVSAFSSTSQASQLFQFEFPANGRVIFRSDGSRGPLPTCAASASSNRWAIDASTSAGKAQLAGLLAAAAQGKPVTVVGKGNCDAWGDAETVDNFYYY